MANTLRCLNFYPPGVKEILNLDRVAHVQSADIDDEIVDANLMDIQCLFTNDAWVHILKEGIEMSFVSIMEYFT